jgi:hypothetical protein
MKKISFFLKKGVDKSLAMVYNRYCCEGQNKNEKPHKASKMGV